MAVYKITVVSPIAGESGTGSFDTDEKSFKFDTIENMRLFTSITTGNFLRDIVGLGITKIEFEQE